VSNLINYTPNSHTSRQKKVWAFIQQMLDGIQSAGDTGRQLRHSGKHNGSLSNGVLNCYADSAFTFYRHQKMTHRAKKESQWRNSGDNDERPTMTTNATRIRH